MWRRVNAVAPAPATPSAARSAPPAPSPAPSPEAPPTTTRGPQPAENPDVVPDQPEVVHPRAAGESTAPAQDGRALANGMFQLPGGTYTMGGDGPTSQPNERPPHQVTIDPFWIDRTEVTVADMRACIRRGAAPNPRSRRFLHVSAAEGACPSTASRGVLADAYCRAVGKRLPHRSRVGVAAARGPERVRFPGAAAPFDLSGGA